jgi:hypothetical protein
MKTQTCAKINSEEATVKFLSIEASAANLITYQQKVEWLERELSVGCHNQLVLLSFIKSLAGLSARRPIDTVLARTKWAQASDTYLPSSSRRPSFHRSENTVRKC